jgi:Helix-turn-helix domain
MAGRTVAYVRRKLGCPYSIAPDAQAMLEGKYANEDTILKPGQHVEFVKLSGRKGAIDNPNEYFLKSGDLRLKLDQLLFKVNRLEELLRQVIKDQAPAKDYYTVAEFAELVGLEKYTVREHCRLGRLRGEKTDCGRGNNPEWRISHAELIRYRNYGLLPLKKDRS